MARRVPLPRLTQRQRSARWQRERRQQAIIVTVFTAILVFVLGLAAWAATDRYYQANLTPAASIQGFTMPKREYQAQLSFELVKLYHDYGVPPGFENDPQLQSVKAAYGDVALEHAVEHRVLDLAAREAGITVTAQQIDDQYLIDYGESRARHILVSVPSDAADAAVADANAKAKARAIADRLRDDPMNDAVWTAVASASSDDPGSKESGGDLGFAGKGSYVAEFEAAVRTLPIGQISDPVKTTFGYHVIQVTSRRSPEETDLFKKYATYGYGAADLKAQARYDVLRKAFEDRQVAASATGKVEQVHLARIRVDVPSLAGGNFQAFSDAIRKQTEVRTALDEGKDFADVAKDKSDDTDTKDKGGDIGWVVRGMLTDPNAESLVFSTEVGKTTEPVSTSSSWTVYKVLEKEAQRDVTEEQKSKIKLAAYDYWLARQKKVYDVKKLLPGLAFE